MRVSQVAGSAVSLLIFTAYLSFGSGVSAMTNSHSQKPEPTSQLDLAFSCEQPHSQDKSIIEFTVQFPPFTSATIWNKLKTIMEVRAAVLSGQSCEITDVGMHLLRIVVVNTFQLNTGTFDLAFSALGIVELVDVTYYQVAVGDVLLTTQRPWRGDIPAMRGPVFPVLLSQDDIVYAAVVHSTDGSLTLAIKVTSDAIAHINSAINRRDGLQVALLVDGIVITSATADNKFPTPDLGFPGIESNDAFYVAAVARSGLLTVAPARVQHSTVCTQSPELGRNQV